MADAFRVPRSERIFEPFVSRQRNALTGKAWEDTVEGLGKEKIRFWIVAEVEAFKNT